MSEIKFSADLDTSKLEAAVKQSNATIKDWAKGVEKAGTQSDQGINKMTKSLKDAIKDQKELIRSIESDVKKLQKAYDEASAGKGKQSAYNELRAAKRALAEEQGTLIGLQKEQIAANNKESDSAEGIISKLKGWALGLVSVGAALKITKSIIESTEYSQRQFERITTAASSAVGYFFKSIASGDWSNFSKGMDNAIRGAVEYIDAMEKLANKQNEQKIKSSELDIKIAELRDETYDKDKSNNEARKAALTQIINLEEEKYKGEAEKAKELYEINLKKAATDSGLAQDQIRNFLKEYSSLEDLIDMGEKYNEITKLMRKPGMNAEYVRTLLKEREALGVNAAAAGAYAKQISKVTPEVRKQLSEFEASANEAEAAFGSKNRRDKMQLAEVTNKIKQDAEEQKKKAAEETELNNQLTKQKELLNKVIESGNEKEIKAIGDKIVALNKEIDARDRLAKKVIEAAEFEGFVPTVVSTSGISTPSVVPQTKKPTAQKQWDQYQKEKTNIAESSSRWAKEMQKAVDANDKNRVAALNKEKELRSQITGEVANLVYMLGQESGLSEKNLNMLGSSLDAFQKIMAGGPAGWVGAASSLLMGLVNLLPDQTKKFADQIARINFLLDEQQRIVESSKRLGGEKEALEEYIKLLKEQERVSFKAFGAKASLETQQAWIDAKNAVKDAEQSLNDLLSGGITENDLADAISKGIIEGADEGAQYLNDVLNKAILNIFQSKLLDSPWMKYYKQYVDKILEDSKITPEEQSGLDDFTKFLQDKFKPIYDSMGAITNSGPQAGLSGAISRQITEDTGSELAGLFRRFADDERAVKDYSIMGVNHLVAIEANTFNTVEELKKTNAKLDTVITNTQPAYSGEL